MAIAAFSIAGMLLAIFQSFALGLAKESFRAWEFFGIAATTAFFLHYLQTLAAFTLVTALCANMILTF